MRFTVMAGGLYLLLCLCMCGGNPATYETEVIDGVTHVHNLGTQWENESPVTLEFVRTIGSAETSDENYMFFRPFDVDLDDEGNIYVLDAGNNRIQKFDGSGNYLATVGKEGSGPGEFQEPSAFCVTADTRIYVAENSNARVQVFDAEGNYTRVLRIDFVPRGIRELPGGGLVFNAPVVPRSPEDDFTGSLFALFNMETGDAERFFEPVSDSDTQIQPFINAVHYDIMPDGSIVAAFRYLNRIDVVGPDGTPSVTIDRPLNYEISNVTEERTYTIQGQEMTLGIPVLTFVSRGIGIDEKGRIWSGTFTKQPPPKDVNISLRMDTDQQATRLENKEDEKDEEGPAESHFELYDANGVLLGYVPEPIPYTIMRVFGDRLFLIDADGIAVHEYRIAG